MLKKRLQKKVIKNKNSKTTNKLYYFIVLPKKNNIFFCLTHSNGNLIKNWTLPSFKINKQQWRSRGQVKRISFILKNQLKKLNGIIIIKCYATTFRYLKAVQLIAKRLTVRKIILNYNVPFNGCKLRKTARK